MSNMTGMTTVLMEATLRKDDMTSEGLSTEEAPITIELQLVTSL